jgi:hypothetical protein
MLQKYHALSRLGPSTFNDGLENEPTEFGKIITRQLLPAMPLFANGSTSRCCQRGTLEQKSRKLLDIAKGSI